MKLTTIILALAAMLAPLSGSAQNIGQNVNVLLPGNQQMKAVVIDSVGNVQADDADYSDIVDAIKERSNNDLKRKELEFNRERYWGKVATEITLSVFALVMAVIFLCLLFAFINRRTKIKLAMRAVEANYPLPQGSFGGRVINNYYTNHYASPAAVMQIPPQTPPQAPKQAAQASDTGSAPKSAKKTDIPVGIPISPAGDGSSIYDYNLSRFSGGATLAVVGFSLMIWGILESSAFLACVFMIIMLIGVSRVWLEYMAQRSMLRNAAMMRAVAEQTETAQQPEAPTPSRPEDYQPKEHKAPQSNLD